MRPRFSRPAVPFASIDKGDGTPPRQWPRAGRDAPVGSDPGEPGGPQWPRTGDGAEGAEPWAEQSAPRDQRGRPVDPFEGLPIPHRSWTTKRGSQVTVAGCCLPLPIGCLTTVLAAGAVAALRVARGRASS